MSTKTTGVVGRGTGCQKVGIDLGSCVFYPNSSQPGMFQTFAWGRFTDEHTDKEIIYYYLIMLEPWNLAGSSVWPRPSHKKNYVWCGFWKIYVDFSALKKPKGQTREHNTRIFNQKCWPLEVGVLGWHWKTYGQTNRHASLWPNRPKGPFW